MEIIADAFVEVPSGQQIDLIQSTYPCELISQMQIIDYPRMGPAPIWYRHSHVAVDCQPGDILVVLTQNQASNPYNYYVEQGGGIILTPDATGISNWNTPSFDPVYSPVLAEDFGYNLAHNHMHHGPFNQHGGIIVPEGISGTMYVAVLRYTAGDAATTAGQYMVVDSKTGLISVLRIRK